MRKGHCEECYHWQDYGYCAVEGNAHDGCEWFVLAEGVRFYLKSGRASLTTRATSAGGSAAKPAEGKDEDED
jgi:hypothetical protein